MSWIGAAIGGASLISGLFGGSAAQSAASTQAAASEYAAQISQNEFNTITQQESPFFNAGYGALNNLNQGLGIGTNTSGSAYGQLLKPFTADMMAQYSPAYNFQLQQGRQGTLNGDETQRSALGGAAQKDLISYNQNLANTAWGNAFNQYNTQQGNIYSRLAGLTQLGQNAAANTGYQGTTLAGQQGQAAMAAGTAQAGGIVGAANAYTGALNNLGVLPFLSSPSSTPATTPYTGFVGNTGSGLIDPSGNYVPWDAPSAPGVG